ncbi:vascular cell adhesion protein 1-like isoform X2 [Heptranchias perlo]|uniref:vascular cell adhesion protein 1-like isoform X2 n=1 Tax=Heptranchias perlo TaxID=212740 RepID=UPI00355A110C
MHKLNHPRFLIPATMDKGAVYSCIISTVLAFWIQTNVAGFEVWINTNPPAVEFGDSLEVNCSTTCADPSMTVEYKPGIHPNRTNSRDWITDRFPSIQNWDLVVPCSIICLSDNNKLKEEKKVVTVYNRELKITSPPEVLKVNKTYSLECIGPRVYPKNKLILTWLRGSEIVQRVSTGEKGSPDEDKRLWNVFNLTASGSDDGQEYTCLAEVDLGSNTTKPITNSSVTLQTYYPPTEAQVRKTADDWIEGKSQTLSCNAAGNPAPQVSWIKDEQIYFGEKLHIPSVQLRDGDKPQNTSISVNNKTVSGSPIHVSKGDEVTMTCDTNGNPPATFQWEAPSKGSNDETGPPGVLRISRATSEHHGIYKCRATNKYGTDENEVDIRVKGQTSARRLAAKVLGFTSVAIIAAAVLITMIIYFRNKRKESKKQQE